MQRCRHCDDELPEAAPPSVTSCKSYADWRARQFGDMLTEAECMYLRLDVGLCRMCVAIDKGLEILPELD